MVSIMQFDPTYILFFLRLFYVFAEVCWQKIYYTPVTSGSCPVSLSSNPRVLMGKGFADVYHRMLILPSPELYINVIVFYSFLRGFFPST